MRHDDGMSKLPFSLVSIVCSETSGGQAAASLKETSNNRGSSDSAPLCVATSRGPEAERASFDLEAGTA